MYSGSTPRIKPFPSTPGSMKDVNGRRLSKKFLLNKNEVDLTRNKEIEKNIIRAQILQSIYLKHLSENILIEKENQFTSQIGEIWNKNAQFQDTCMQKKLLIKRTEEEIHSIKISKLMETFVKNAKIFLPTLSSVLEALYNRIKCETMRISVKQTDSKTFDIFKDFFDESHQFSSKLMVSLSDLRNLIKMMNSCSENKVQVSETQQENKIQVILLEDTSKQLEKYKDLCK